MIFPLYIARRYLIAKKSHNLINIISVVSVIGITAGTAALVIVLSVFNGFQGLVTSLYNAFNPDLQITVQEGKTFHIQDMTLEQIHSIPGVAVVSEVVEENALARFGDRQYIVTIKGVSDDFTQLVPLQEHLLDGKYVLRSGDRDFAVIGAGVAYYLGIYPDVFSDPMSLYLPKRTRKNLAGMPDQSFNSGNVYVTGVFAVQQEFDMQYVIIPIGLARQLLEYTDEVTALEIGVEKGADIKIIRNEIQEILGSEFLVKNRLEQQALLYHIMKTEKWAVYLILTFILVIAAFNMIGSLSMLIIDKQKDIAVLWSLGASKRVIKNIFYAEGMMMSLAGGLIGLFLGTAVALLQQYFGFISLGGGEGSYIVDAYPVRVQFPDLVFVMLTVLIIGLLTSWYPVRQISRKYLSKRLNFFLMR